ncbi:hypothetical protein FSP39_017340 [Pinctada imbricata]|uniref:Nephrocystin 3-like N-terminal domain-containing protein n=1 Tax=Pinctada imbricata TaxID=66713 RepID=A0AA89BXJ4_PINIB|nr:hypothetical protein FSP39_017340 [Pinctada imbricata]
MDEGKRCSEDVRWALESFNFGIKDYFEDTFRKFHDDLHNNVVQTRGVCCQKCSKHKPVEDWCSLCSEWRNGILAKHVFRSTVKVNWKNIDSSKLPSDIKEVKKVFLPNWYKGKLDSNDLSSCLNIMTNSDPWIPGRPSFYFKLHDKFVGRKWLNQKLRSHLNQRKVGVILVAEPGFGKSALVANWIKSYSENENKPLLGYHICKHDSRASLDASSFIINLWQDLRKRYAYFNYQTPSRFKNNKDIKPYCTFDPLLCFDELISNPLHKANLSERSLFIVDAIDECQKPAMGTTSISDLLLQQYKILMPFVSIFMTSRNDTALLSGFRQFKQVHIDPKRDENINDLKLFIQHGTRCTNEDINRLIKDTSHNFLILRSHLSENHNACKVPNLNRIDTIFEMYESTFFRLYGNDFPRKYQVDRLFFEVLSSQLVQMSITVDMMKDILKYSSPPANDDEFEEMIHRMKINFIRISKKQEIHVTHTSLYDWLKSDGNVKFRVKVHRGHNVWIHYLYNKLKLESRQSSLSMNESFPSIYHIFSLATHFIHANNESLTNELNSGKFRINDMRISCTACWRKILPQSAIYDSTISHIGYAASIFDNYEFIQTLVKMSRTTDWTKEASIASGLGHIEAFVALNISGRVDMKEKHIAVDNWMVFGKFCVPEILKDIENEEILVGTNNNTVQQFLLDAVGNFTFDYVSIFHIFVMKGYLNIVRDFTSTDISLLREKTGNGWDVFDLAVAYDNLDMLTELLSVKPMKKRTWYLWYASLRGSITIVKYLLEHDIRDQCAKYNADIRHSNSGHYATFLQNSTDAESSFSISQRYKFRRLYLRESALMVAVKRGYSKVVRALLSHSTECLEHKDAFGFTPLAASIYFRNESIIAILLNHGANRNFAMKSSLNDSDLEFFNRFLRFPLEKKWNYHNAYNGATIFHLSTLRPTCLSTTLLRKIVQNDPEINLDIRDDQGHSPLYYAICHPDADNTYAHLEDYLQPKSHRMAFFLIEAAHTLQISDSLLLELGICGRKKQDHSDIMVMTTYKDSFCKRGINFPPLMKTITITFKGDAISMNTFLNNSGIASNDISVVAVAFTLPEYTFFALRHLPQNTLNSKQIIKYIKDKYKYDADIYIKFYPGRGSSVIYM